MNMSVKILLLCLVVLVSGVVQAQEAAPVEHRYDVELPEAYQVQDIEWSPDGDYFAVYLSQSAGDLKWQVYARADGRLVYDGQFVAWYADGSRMLVEDESGISAMNLATGLVDFSLPHEALDFAGSHYAFLSWMTWLDGMPQEWVSDEILMFDVSSLSAEILPDEPNFFVYDSQTGEEIFSLAGVWRPPVYLPGREQVVVSRLPLGLDIYERATWQVTDSLDGFVVPYSRRWWDNDGEHLLVAATTEENDIEPAEGWDFYFWMPGEGLSAPFRGAGGAAQWVASLDRMVWVNDGKQIVFYDTTTGVQDFVLEYEPDIAGITYIDVRSARYLLVIKSLEDGTRDYAVWDAETAVWTPLGNPGFASLELRGDAVIVSNYGEFFSVDDLNEGAEKMVIEHGDPILEFSPDNRFALTLSYMVEGEPGIGTASPEDEPRLATLYDLASGETSSFEIGATTIQILWQPDSSGFALVTHERDTVSIWDVNP